jgi:hypothetical protein
LLVAAIYAIVVGFLLIFPSLGSEVLDRRVTDAAVWSAWGASLIVIGLLAVAVASNVEKYGGLAWAFAMGLLIATFDLLYFFLRGDYTARNVIVPIIINTLLIAWIWSVKPKG